MNTGKWDKADKLYQIWHENTTAGKKRAIPLHLKYFSLNPLKNEDYSQIVVSVFLCFRKIHSAQLVKSCRAAYQKFLEAEDLKKAEFRNFELAEDYEMIYPSAAPPSCQEIEERAEKNRRVFRGFLSHDKEIIFNLYEEEFPRVVRMVTKNSGTLENARDLFQDSLVILWEKAMRNEFDPGCSPGTYLHSVCRILWYEQLRRKKRNKAMFDEPGHSGDRVSFIDTESHKDDFEKISRILNLMGEPCKLLLEAYYYKKMNWEDIAGLFGYASAASARNQKYKCLERIRKLVHEEKIIP